MSSPKITLQNIVPFIIDAVGYTKTLHQEGILERLLAGSPYRLIALNAEGSDVVVRNEKWLMRNYQIVDVEDWHQGYLDTNDLDEVAKWVKNNV